MCDFLIQDGLSLDVLEALSYHSTLGISLKRTVRHFDKENLLKEVESVADWYDEHVLLHDLPLDYRIKSLQSAAHKYDRYYPDKQLSRVFDDLLGFRSLRDTYDDIEIPDGCTTLRVADMSQGKQVDDGYRGVHVYYQKDNFHYPIEIQYNTYFDRQMNNWLHKYLYKKGYPLEVGAKMRQLYEDGAIRTEVDFVEVLSNVLRCSEECR